MVVLLLAACTSGNSREAGETPSTVTTAVELAPAMTAAGTVSHDTIMVGGRVRTYRLYAPSEVGRVAVPLFVGLHGGGGDGDGDEFSQTSQIERLAESNGFLVVHPDGVPMIGRMGGSWNAGLCCVAGSVATAENIDDVGFIDALISDIAHQHVLDTNRIYAFGHSNGAVMSYRLACELADRVVAVGVHAGALGIDACHPAQPVSVLQIHGDADLAHPIEGGTGPASVPGIDFPPATQGFETLAALNQCPSGVVTTDGGRREDVREPCARGTTLKFVTISGGDHTWGGARSGYDPIAEIVQFLLAHPRKQ
jgi:polyhydroxybutyrate depolymerase